MRNLVSGCLALLLLFVGGCLALGWLANRSIGKVDIAAATAEIEARKARNQQLRDQIAHIEAGSADAAAAEPEQQDWLSRFSLDDQLKIDAAVTHFCEDARALVACDWPSYRAAAAREVTA